jgi:replicative DNA helicase
LIDLKRQVSTATVISMSDLMLQATETLGDRYEVVQQGGDIRSENMPTGVQVLDDILDGGIPRQRLVYILGGTGMGKTSFGLQMARYCAVEARQPVLFFSIEMTGESQAVKMFSSVCEIPLNRLNSANFNCEDFGRMYSAVTNYDSVDFYIDDKSRTINDICLKSKQFAARHGDVGIILIDYLALIKTNENSGNRVQQIEGICYELNQLKKDLNTRVVVLSQIGRAVKERNDKRPQINDAKESGAVEETADLILSCYRDEYYNRDTQSRGTIELAVLKNRYGREGTATAIWQGQYSRIVNIQTEVF